MGEIKINVGDILTSCRDNEKHRVLYIDAEVMSLCKMDISRCEIIMCPTDYIINRLKENSMIVLSDMEERLVYDTSTWTEEMKKDFEKKARIVRMIDEEYGPTYLGLMYPNKTMLYKIKEIESISKTTLWKYIRLYCQAGLDVYALVDPRHFPPKHGHGNYDFKKRNGRPDKNGLKNTVISTDTLRAQFQDAMEYYKGGRNRTIKDAYLYLLSTYYRETTVTPNGISLDFKPITETPTYRQLQYYISTHMTQKEKDIKTTSYREYWNDKRLLVSDTLHGLNGVCDRCQMDEVEVDVSLVDSIRQDQTVGRPIVYVISDIYSRMILGVGVGFDNNSLIGLTSCLQNLIEDKVKYCADYGIVINESMWPSGYIPNRILADRGAEYVSKTARGIFRELGITLELAPAGMGSLKGVVEQWFHQLHSSQKAVLEKHGGISKRHDSKHHKEACLTLDDFTTILLQFVIYHNSHYIPDYPLSAEMVRDDVRPIPCTLWEYGCKTFGPPKKIKNPLQFRYSLLLPMKASVSRKGVKCNGLMYMNLQDKHLLSEMESAGNKWVPFECRIDPRDIGRIYYLRDNKIMKANLNSLKAGQTSYAGLNLAEWNTIRTFLAARKKEGLFNNTIMQGYITQMNEAIVKNAKRMAASCDKDMRTARHQEKYLVQQRYLLFNDFKDITGTDDMLDYMIDSNVYIPGELIQEEELLATPEMHDKSEAPEPPGFFDEDFNAEEYFD